MPLFYFDINKGEDIMKKVLKRMCSMILVIILVTMCGCGGTDKKIKVHLRMERLVKNYKNLEKKEK